ncbi:MAG: FAD-dependent oxidoreductase [Acidobacteria bacterium]|nr:FAD-dependent oxidoreductase [Acidobacteriota bacterium]
MPKEITRRELMRSITAVGLFVAGTMTPLSSIVAAQTGKVRTRGPQKQRPSAPRSPATLADGRVVQPRRELSILRKTDVLVVGGGPAGTAAALSARRLGVDVTLVERYGYLGGLATGGLVLAIFPLYARDNRQVILGIGEEMMRRLDKIKFGIIERGKAPVYPTVDAEAFKYVLAEMVLESGIHPYLNCWGVDAVIDAKGAVRGAVFESKSGRQAILADVVVDASGDGDIYAAAGAPFEKVIDSIGLVSRIGNVDIEDMAGENFEHQTGTRKQAGARPTRGAPVAALQGNVGSPTPAPRVNWLNMKGPVGDALDVAEVSMLELRHRRALWNNLERARKRPGAENAFMAETAPQMGVRLSRLLAGTKKLTMNEAKAGTKFKDVIGYSGNYVAPEFQIPYNCLVPAKLENLLAAGRCISADFELADTLRLIPICWVTGQAAGVAAAISIQDKCRPRDVNIAKLQSILRKQGAYLG